MLVRNIARPTFSQSEDEHRLGQGLREIGNARFHRWETPAKRRTIIRTADQGDQHL